MIDLENARLVLALSVNDITLKNSNYKELIQALEEAKEIIGNTAEYAHDQSPSVLWLAKYFQDNQKEDEQ